jgi:hypothetical protein
MTELGLLCCCGCCCVPFTAFGGDATPPFATGRGCISYFFFVSAIRGFFFVFLRPAGCSEKSRGHGTTTNKTVSDRSHSKKTKQKKQHARTEAMWVQIKMQMACLVFGESTQRVVLYEAKKDYSRFPFARSTDTQVSTNKNNSEISATTGQFVSLLVSSRDWKMKRKSEQNSLACSPDSTKKKVSKQKAIRAGTPAENRTKEGKTVQQKK